MTESEQILLQGWSYFLGTQGAYFNECIVNQIGHSHVPDVINAAFLEVDENFVKPTIEKAVATFVRTGSWPALTHREYLHLIFRVCIAKGGIALILRGPPAEMVDATAAGGTANAVDIIKRSLPDLENRERTLQWLFCDLWNIGGKQFLTRKADDFLNPAPLSTPSGCPEVLIYAPLQRVMAVIISLEVSDGGRLESQSENTLSFSSPSKSLVVDNLYGRATYTLSPEGPGIRVCLASAIITNYGTASESSTPVDGKNLRIDSQNFLMQIKAEAEK
jgi:hypothetical protein